MKERPMLFADEMVRAILSGQKTQTRRLYKTVKHPDFGCEMAACELAMEDPDVINRACPFGRIGDQIWVRETWGNVSNAFDDDGFAVDWIPNRPAKEIHEMPFGGGYYLGHVIYRADGEFEWSCDDDGGGEPRSAWHPSIHMPRAASRIQLEITGIRVERLQDISNEDAVAEGIGAPLDIRYAAIDGFKPLWNSTGGNWDANPWVWVIEFKRIERLA